MATMGLPTTSRYVVVGAGIHGLSTAYHLAKELRARGSGSGADIVVLDKTSPGSGASGIACGVVRNNYFQPAMSELMQACVEVWESDPAAYHYNPVGYIALGARVQEPDLVATYERQEQIGYRSELIVGAAKVDADGTEIAHFRLRCRPARRPSEQRLDASHELPHIKRLRYIVISADFESGDFVCGLASGRQHKDRGDEPGLADRPAHLESASSRQHDIEDDQIEREKARLFERFNPVDGVLDNIALLAQAVAYGHAQCLFVFDQQNGVAHVPGYTAHQNSNSETSRQRSLPTSGRSST